MTNLIVFFHFSFLKRPSLFRDLERALSDLDVFGRLLKDKGLGADEDDERNPGMLLIFLLPRNQDKLGKLL